ncbi:MAG: hypothetical protein LHV69_11035 [Elusimicrobia bacterium]|nr:hypothetical protein [Candidatus Obscuribacterium magneticum]
MKRIVLPLLLGALGYFLWETASWTILPWHNQVLKRLPEETLIRDTLKVVVEKPGIYVFPGWTNAEGKPEPRSELDGKMATGPVGFLAFQPVGKTLSMSRFMIGFAVAVMVSGICLLVLMLSRGFVVAVIPRVLYVVLLGILGWVYAHVPYWNWMSFSSDYTLLALMDTLIGFAIVGSILAKFVPRNENSKQ